MAKIDHHIHTVRHSPDSRIEPLELVEKAREIGLDAVVITEHDYQWSSDELAELAARASGVTVLSGVEISAKEGHFLVYGLPDLRDTPAGIGLADLLQVVRAHRAAIIAAHPFRWEQDFERIIAEHGPVFDALELVSNSISDQTRSRTQLVLEAYPMLGATGSSDGHNIEVVGCYFTEFPGTVASMSEFLSALRTKAGCPRHREGSSLSCGPVNPRFGLHA